MINLLPTEEKKSLVREYRIRVIISALLFLLSAVCIAVVFLIPVYFITHARESDMERSLAEIKEFNKNNVGEEARGIIKDIKNKISKIGDYQNRFLVTHGVIDKILIKIEGTVKVLGISYDFTKDDKGVVGRKITISGVAPNREALKGFITRLIAEPTFKDVSVPLSNYLPNNDLQFTISAHL